MSKEVSASVIHLILKVNQTNYIFVTLTAADKTRHSFRQKQFVVFTMGLSLSRTKKLKIIELIPKGREHSHLVAIGQIIFRKDFDFKIPEIEISIAGYFPALVRLWPEVREGAGCYAKCFFR